MYRLFLVWLLAVTFVAGVANAKPSSSALARSLYQEFLRLPHHPNYLKNCKDGAWLHSIAKQAGDPVDGVKRLGIVQDSPTTATLWMLTDPANMSGRVGLYTVRFRSSGSGWEPVDGSVVINALQALPKDDVVRCTIATR